jgi:hypothetical protein
LSLNDIPIRSDFDAGLLALVVDTENRLLFRCIAQLALVANQREPFKGVVAGEDGV